MEWLTDLQTWASLVTLTALEIVLGIDNLVFIAIVAGRLPLERQNRARQVGLALALITRLALLASIVWIIGLTQPLFDLFGQPVSWRDIILIAGGLFLLYKGTREIHQGLEGGGQEEAAGGLAGQRDHGRRHGKQAVGHGDRHHHRRRDHARSIEAPC